MNDRDVADAWIFAMLAYIVSLLTSSLFWTILSVLSGFVAAIAVVDMIYDGFREWRKSKKKENSLAV